MNPKYLVLSDEDFGRPVDISRSTDLYECEADADIVAEDAVRSGSRMVYVFKLESVYVPSDGRMVEVRQVELASSRNSVGGYGGSD